MPIEPRSDTKLRTLPLLVMLVLLAPLAVSASLTCACPSLEYLEKTTVTEVAHHHLSLLINCKGLQKIQKTKLNFLFFIHLCLLWNNIDQHTNTTAWVTMDHDHGRKRKRTSTPAPKSGGTLAPVIEMLDDGCRDQEETTLSKVLADAGKSGTLMSAVCKRILQSKIVCVFTKIILYKANSEAVALVRTFAQLRRHSGQKPQYITRWECILDLISKSVKKGNKCQLMPIDHVHSQDVGRSTRHTRTGSNT